MRQQVDSKLDETRFQFGQNWTRFLSLVSEERVSIAQESLKQMLNIHSFVGKSFLDIGCGSGIFSLAARRMGARVHSFDYDPQAVACTAELKRRFCPDDPDWVVEQGSVLDTNYLASLGSFDVVYAWGVLHHTGHMWQALDNVQALVAPSGQLWVAIYNDQGRRSMMWARIKRAYNRLPRLLRLPFALVVMAPSELKSFLLSLLSLSPLGYLQTWFHSRTRGMSRWYDFIDWVGGYPFEVAKPEAIFRFYRERRFVLDELKTCGGGMGCNEFVFRKVNNQSN